MIRSLCVLFPAIQAQVTSRDSVGEWVKFTVNVFNIFKKTKDRLRRGEEAIWVSAKDLACRCPKLRPGKTYLILGHDSSTSRGGLVLDRNSVAIQWEAKLTAKLKQYAKTPKCWDKQ